MLRQADVRSGMTVCIVLDGFLISFSSVAKPASPLGGAGFFVPCSQLQLSFYFCQKGLKHNGKRQCPNIIKYLIYNWFLI